MLIILETSVREHYYLCKFSVNLKCIYIYIVYIFSLSLLLYTHIYTHWERERKNIHGLWWNFVLTPFSGTQEIFSDSYKRQRYFNPRNKPKSKGKISRNVTSEAFLNVLLYPRVRNELIYFWKPNTTKCWMCLLYNPYPHKNKYTYHLQKLI